MSSTDSNQPANEWGWYAGIPSYHPYADEIIFMESPPIDVSDLLDYREQLLRSSEIDFATYDLLCLMIESHEIVRAAISRAITSS